MQNVFLAGRLSKKRVKQQKKQNLDPPVTSTPVVDSEQRKSDALKLLARERFGLKMNSQSSERQSSDNHSSDTTPVKQSDSDYNYEDDFEELDSFIKEKSADSSTISATENSNSSDYQQEKGQLESSEKESSATEDDSTDSSQKRTSLSPYDDAQSDDSEPEPEGDVLFTDDQQRAMMELMAQKHDSGDYSDDPPEYNVKERLKELNAELAAEPDPDDRAHRVGFKENLVDLVAPPPEVSDEEDSPRKTLGISNGDKETDAASKEAGGDNKKKQFVVERDGKFEVMADHELTASERAMFNIPDDNGEGGGDARIEDSPSKTGEGRGDGQTNHNNSNMSHKENVKPNPPSKPRPNTANGYTRRTVRPSQSPRPQTASSTRSSSSSNTSLQDFNYVSQYAMSPSEKQRAQERARLKEQQRKEEEERQRQEEEYRREEAEACFKGWLRRKQDEDQKRRQSDQEKRKTEKKEDRLSESEGYYHPLLEPYEPIIRLQAKENEEAFKGWLKEKQSQTKREKLLKKREEQEIKDGYYIRSREECDQAYKEWLKNKYAEMKRQKNAEKLRVRSFRSQVRRSRKQQMMARAVRQSAGFQFVDYYGYRF